MWVSLSNWGHFLLAFRLVFLLLCLLLFVFPHTSSKSLNTLRYRREPGVPHTLPPSREDVLIGETVSMIFSEMPSLQFKIRPETSSRGIIIPKNYQHVLAFLFAIHEINNNNKLLPNTTLGSVVADDLFSARRACEATLDLLFKSQGNVLNYSCEKGARLLAVIGALTSPSSIQMANVLSTYKVPQLSYGSFDPVLSDQTQFPFFFRMIPNEEPQYDGIVELLKYFAWKWIGLLLSSDGTGEAFLRTLRPRLLQNNICVAVTEFLPMVTTHTSNKTVTTLLRSLFSALWLHPLNVWLVHGDGQSMEGLRIVLVNSEIVWNRPMENVWIITAQWDVTTVLPWNPFTAKSLNGTLSFSLHSNVVPGFQDFLESLNPYKSNIVYFQVFWQTAFTCSLPEYDFPLVSTCSGEQSLGSLSRSVFELEMSGQSYSIYNAVYAVAHAIHAMSSPTAKERAMRTRDREGRLAGQPWQLHFFLRNVRFNNSAGDEIFFNDHGDLEFGYNVNNLVTFPNRSFQRVRVGWIDPHGPDGKKFTLNGSAVVWNPKFNQVSIPLWKASSQQILPDV
uniref:Vomeronasal type-2 receptor 26-like isoform X2 n=1 Tax=Pogona vitticeps TaxID=103695 RepID=A0ABM5EIU5_9SAUR